jgi:hypothetical protein
MVDAKMRYRAVFDLHAQPFPEVHLASSGSRIAYRAPVFLTFLVLLLLIINGAIVWSRW